MTEGLAHFYPFRGDMEDKVGSAIDGFGYTPIMTEDRYTKSERAMKFNNDNTI